MKRDLFVNLLFDIFTANLQRITSCVITYNPILAQYKEPNEICFGVAVIFYNEAYPIGKLFLNYGENILGKRQCLYTLIIVKLLIQSY